MHLQWAAAGPMSLKLSGESSAEWKLHGIPQTPAWAGPPGEGTGTRSRGLTPAHRPEPGPELAERNRACRKRRHNHNSHRIRPWVQAAPPAAPAPRQGSKRRGEARQGDSCDGGTHRQVGVHGKCRKHSPVAGVRPRRPQGSRPCSQGERQAARAELQRFGQPACHGGSRGKTGVPPHNLQRPDHRQLLHRGGHIQP